MTSRLPLFANRREAGRRLGDVLAAQTLGPVIVYALPRGGVPVALEVARRLAAPLDLILVRKIGAPGYPELALAAVVDGAEPLMVVNESVQRQTGASDAFIAQAQARELAEIERRRRLYLGDRPRRDPAGQTAIVVDDGLATGATALAAVRGLKRQGAGRVVLAVPVASREAAAVLGGEADDLVCLAEPEHLMSVGRYYGDFHQLEDTEVLAQLAEAKSFAGASPP